MAARQPKTKHVLLREIHVFVSGGTNNDNGREFGDHCEIYRPEGTGSYECPDCGRTIEEGWCKALEAMRQHNGAQPLSCLEVEVNPDTGDRTVRRHLQLPANMAKEWFDKGSAVVNVDGEYRSFMSVHNQQGNPLAEENARLKSQISAMERGE